jgi:hypothetical protein
LQVRSITVELQKHVQVETVAAEVVRRSRFYDRVTHEHRQNSGTGKETEKENQYRGFGKRGAGTTFSQTTETISTRNNSISGQFAVGEGGCEGVVL